MSAQPIDFGLDDARTAFVPMQLSDVAAVAAIERSIYAAPWSEGNFVDSLTAGYAAWVLRAEGGRPPTRILGYLVVMVAVDEAHLLNVSVARAAQPRGYGLFLLKRAVALAHEGNAASVILEVRPSNARALSVYRRFGFREFGVRKRYYPASADDPAMREDAIVMRLAL